MTDFQVARDCVGWVDGSSPSALRHFGPGLGRVAGPYPDIVPVESQPTLVPSGNSSMNVNGMAISIELYLGSTLVITDVRGLLHPFSGRVTAINPE